MLEGNVSEYRTDTSPNEEVSPLAIAMGIGCLVLSLPAAFIGIMEFVETTNYGILGWTMNSILYSSTSVLLLIGTGLWLMGILKTQLAKMSVGIPLVMLSLFTLIRRYTEINANLQSWGESFVQGLDYPWVHEQMELSFLGILIGVIIMTK